MTTRTRLALAAVALVVLAWSTGLSGAAMTDEVTEDPAAITGGTLNLITDATGTTALDAATMRPGQTRSAIVELRNAGDVPAALSAGVREKLDEPAEAALSAVLALRIEDCGATAACPAPVTKYDASLRDFATADLGAVAAGASRFVRVTLDWGADKADPSRQGARAEATLVWQAVAGESAP